MAEATLELLPRRPIAAPRGGLLRRPICPGREPPILAVKRPARTYKTRIQTGKFTMEKAQAFNRPGRPGPAAHRSPAWPFAKIARLLCLGRVLSALDHRATANLPGVRCGAPHSSRTSTGSNNKARMASCPFKVEAGCLMLHRHAAASMAGLAAGR